MRGRDLILQLRDIAAEQAGFVTSAQAARFDVTAEALDRAARSGLLRRVRHGVYMLETWPLHPEEPLASAWLAVDARPLPWERAAADPSAIVSHASAASLRGLGTIIPTLPDLTQTSQRSRREEIRFHVAPFAPADWDWLDVAGLRLPVTTPARTIIDLLLGHEDGEYLARAARQSFDAPGDALAALTTAATRRKARHGHLVELAARLVRDAYPEPRRAS